MFADWQVAVIVLLVLSILFDLLATFMAFCGVCVSTLARKIYYYHSAGEIYVICGEHLNIMA